MNKKEVEQFVDNMMAHISNTNISHTQLFIDPPCGWKYGFPKHYVDSNGNRPDNMKQWLLDSGYPQFEIDSYGKHFHVRFWETKET
jgi:hypothetical protein